jgi:hypothetical protein
MGGVVCHSAGRPACVKALHQAGLPMSDHQLGQDAKLGRHFGKRPHPKSQPTSGHFGGQASLKKARDFVIRQTTIFILSECLQIYNCSDNFSNVWFNCLQRPSQFLRGGVGGEVGIALLNFANDKLKKVNSKLTS